MLNLADNISFPDIFTVNLKTIDHINIKIIVFVGQILVLRFKFPKFRTLESLIFHPCILHMFDPHFEKTYNVAS